MKDLFLPGEKICCNEGYIRGHGTLLRDEDIVSTHFGRKVLVDKLITVEPKNNFRYTAEVGDVVVGRVISIFNKRWKIEMNCKSETTLNLSAINLPGVMQRRKVESDEISMRNFFDINDLLVAEIQKVSKNGLAALHTRNEKYKKLVNGLLIVVPCMLLQSLKSRFINTAEMEIIVGCNGYVWLGARNDNERNYKAVSQLAQKLQYMMVHMLPIDFEKL